MRARAPLAFLLLAALSGPARAQEVVAVLGSDLRPYREAFEAFQASLGRPVPLLALADPVPRDTRVVVAFGGRAAVQRYPARTTVVYTLAPGLLLGDSREGPSVKIRMEPEPAVFLASMRRLQPRLRRLAVLWSSDGFVPLLQRLESAGARSSVEVVSERLAGPHELPSALRRLGKGVDAVWLLPDPHLVAPRTLELMRQFSHANRVPFYAPTEGLVELGATAALTVGNAELGRAAADAARRVLAGEDGASDVYVSGAVLTVNLSGARAAGLALIPDELNAAAKVWP